jgi:uncharacterized iron-regulated membrane protein
MGPSQRGAFGGALADNARMTPEQALDAARAGRAGAQPVALYLPTSGAKGGRSGRDGGQKRDDAGVPSITWRIQLRMDNETASANVLVDDASGAARSLPDPLAGDRAAQWIRWLHEGSNSGALWRFVVLLTGVFPPIFAVTGVTMWLRGRRQRKERAALQPGALQAAE